MRGEDIRMTHRWIAHYTPKPAAAIRLFCFPYAGGRASIYYTWAQKLPDFIDVVPIELPGHGTRLNEPLYNSLQRLATEAGDALASLFDLPFALFGHSMGALLSFELAHYVRNEYDARAQHLFLSASRAPHIQNPQLKVHTYPDDVFLEQIRRLEGTPATVLDEPELVDLILPILRADFAVCDAYDCTRDQPLPCEMTVFGGVQDPMVKRDHLAAWEEYCDGTFTLRMFPGGHFFVQSAESTILRYIAKSLHT